MLPAQREVVDATSSHTVFEYLWADSDKLQVGVIRCTHHLLLGCTRAPCLFVYLPLMSKIVKGATNKHGVSVISSSFGVSISRCKSVLLVDTFHIIWKSGVQKL